MRQADRFSHRLPVAWPDPPFHVALWQPEIPPNTGTIGRLCAAVGSPLHLIGPLGFRIDDARARRAGLDYWPLVDLHRHRDGEAFREAIAPERLVLFSTRARTSYTAARYSPGDVLLFGSETRGLPPSLLDDHPDAVYGIPTLNPGVRSLNLANAVAIVLYEALRQHDESRQP